MFEHRVDDQPVSGTADQTAPMQTTDTITNFGSLTLSGPDILALSEAWVRARNNGSIPQEHCTFGEVVDDRKVIGRLDYDGRIISWNGTAIYSPVRSEEIRSGWKRSSISVGFSVSIESAGFAWRFYR
jgi:hypothetical protein